MAMSFVRLHSTNISNSRLVILFSAFYAYDTKGRNFWHKKEENVKIFFGGGEVLNREIREFKEFKEI